MSPQLTSLSQRPSGSLRLLFAAQTNAAKEIGREATTTFNMHGPALDLRLGLLSFLPVYYSPSHVTSLELPCLPTNQQPYHQPKKPQHATEDLNHQHLHEQCAICRVRERCTRPVDAHAHTADQVAHADREAAPEKCVAGIVVG